MQEPVAVYLKSVGTLLDTNAFVRDILEDMHCHYV